MYPNMPSGIKFHGYMALVAIIAFLVQAGLGFQATQNAGTPSGYRYRTWHVKSAKWMFLPVWIITYASGFALPLLV
jgi:hypothetical protein